MAQENGSHFKLVYSHWYNGTSRFPIANGNHPDIARWLVDLVDKEKILIFANHLRTNYLDSLWQLPNSGILFRHSNFIYHFIDAATLDNCVNEDEVDINDGITYFYPIEVEMKGLGLLSGFLPWAFELDGKQYNYEFERTLSNKIIEYLRIGKVKLLITNMVDPSVDKLFLMLVEEKLKNIGIPGNHIVFHQGNISEDYYENNNEQVQMVESILSLTQNAKLFYEFPRSSGLGYVSDIVRESDLDVNIFRDKRFLCFNRSMNRPHRFALCYIALKHQLLEGSTFSFLNYFDNDIVHDLRALFPKENFMEISKIAIKIKKLIPYQLDTHHLEEQDRQSFETVGNNKKEFFANSYIHITSETEFNNKRIPFFSEKTWRPILNLQPFIYVGNFGALKKLKELGFKTFHPYIDETYDLIQDPQQRILMIEKEIKKLADIPLTGIHDLYYSMIDVLLHNQKHLGTFKNRNPLTELFERY
jgi:hypothetical protein